MLEIITSFCQINFRQLLQVYEESIRNAGMERYSHMERNRQLLESEQDFYGFLTDFIHIPGAFYFLWTSDGRYHAALRIEPYRDGVLLAGLETAPDSRRQGCATKLMMESLQYLSANGIHKVYSHISNDNTASVATHQKCGFFKISDCAVFIDGAVDFHSDTYLAEI